MAAVQLSAAPQLRYGDPEEVGMSARQVRRVRDLARSWVEEGRHPALVVLAARRGVIGTLRLEVRCAGPLGLVWWRRPFAISLERPLEVGPAPIETAGPRQREPSLNVTSEAPASTCAEMSGVSARR